MRKYKLAIFIFLVMSLNYLLIGIYGEHEGFFKKLIIIFNFEGLMRLFNGDFLKNNLITQFWCNEKINLLVISLIISIIIQGIYNFTKNKIKTNKNDGKKSKYNIFKRFKIATGVFLLSVLFNLLFPPYITIGGLPSSPLAGEIIGREFFRFIFNQPRYFDAHSLLDIKTLIIFFLISLIISIIIQGIYNFVIRYINKIVNINRKNERIHIFKKFRVAIGVFLLLTLYNLLFPPFVIIEENTILKRYFFTFITEIIEPKNDTPPMKSVNIEDYESIYFENNGNINFQNPSIPIIKDGAILQFPLKSNFFDFNTFTAYSTKASIGEIDERTLIIMLLISFVFSIIIQGIYNFEINKMRKISNNK